MHGATCTICENSQLVVEEFNNQPLNTYDAVFMDIQMPVMNGYEATKAIRQLTRDDAKEITIIAMTANAFAQDTAKALESGMNGHIAKPIDMKLLANTLAKFLDH